MTIKDSFDTEGVISTAGTMGRKRYVPSQDATVVDRLRRGGAILLGKTNTPEIADGVITINGVAPNYDTIASFKYPGARPLYIYIKNAHAGAIPAVRAYAAEFTKESAFGPNGYLRRAGLIAAPNQIRARSQQLARSLQPLNLASLK